jgi:hypothetical protein
MDWDESHGLSREVLEALQALLGMDPEEAEALIHEVEQERGVCLT